MGDEKATVIALMRKAITQQFTDEVMEPCDIVQHSCVSYLEICVD